MPKSTKELTLEYKYAELPEEPMRYRKKKKKKVHKKSDHKHHYVPCMYDVGLYIWGYGITSPYMYRGTYCDICGRIGDIRYNNGDIGIDESELPVFEIDRLWDKFVNLNGD